MLSLDRGTTHGLLAHSDNDVGTLGSIPPVLNREILAEWTRLVPAPQGGLIMRINEILGDVDDGTGLAVMTDAVRAQLGLIASTQENSIDSFLLCCT